MHRKQAIVLGTLGILGLLLLFTVTKPTPSQAASTDGERIALIYAEGVIMGDSPSDNFFGGGGIVSSIGMVQKLAKAQKDDAIKAVVIRVNSPGGSAAASQEIYDAINRCKAEKPVYISMGDICASGGYYISAPATRIWATPATLTGSIGVIMELPRYDELLDKIGVEFRTMKAGAHKDLGSATREMTPEEEAILQKLLTTSHTQFIDAVSRGRVASGQAEMDEEYIRNLADGTIWTGEDALAVGLVDDLGGLHDALTYAATNANLDPDDFVVDDMTVSFWDELLASSGIEMRQSHNPIAQFGQLMGLLTLSRALPSNSMPQASASSAMPQTSFAPTLASRMYLCEMLNGASLQF